jgi:uncharacterized protein
MMLILKRTSKSLLLLLFLASAAFAQFTQMQIPQPSGNVNDFAGKLNPATKQSLENLLTNFRNKTDIEVAAVLIPYEQMNGYAIEDYALEMGRRWGIGIGANNPAALLLIAIKEKGSDGLYSGNTRLEISRHLEGDIPDGLAGEIIRRMRNDLKAGNFDNAMTTGVQTILATIAEKRGISMEGINSNAAYHPPVRRPQKGISPSTIIIGIIVIFFIINLLGRIGRGGGGGGSRRGSDWWVGPIIWGGGGSGWGGSGSSSGDSGGGWGGFGGGGDFGGGGASDSW